MNSLSEKLYISAMKKDSGKRSAPRPFIGMHFRCCNVYTRLYLNRAGTAFSGTCPRCGRKRAEVRVSPEGTDSRFFGAD